MNRTLFDLEKPPRRKPRVLMRVFDVSDGDVVDGRRVDTVRLECGRCGHQTPWIEVRVSEARRGLPCPKCNVTQGQTT